MINLLLLSKKLTITQVSWNWIVNIVFTKKFSFKPVPVKYVGNNIKNVPNNKASGGEIPLHILKQSGFTYQMLTDCMNHGLSRRIFPDSLKFTNITPVYKKDEAPDKENYRPVCVLPLFSKTLKKSFMINLVKLWKKYTNSLLSSFWKAHSSQHGLFSFKKN